MRILEHEQVLKIKWQNTQFVIALQNNTQYKHTYQQDKFICQFLPKPLQITGSRIQLFSDLKITWFRFDKV